LLSDAELCESVSRFPVLLCKVLSPIATCESLDQIFFQEIKAFLFSLYSSTRRQAIFRSFRTSRSEPYSQKFLANLN